MSGHMIAYLDGRWQVYRSEDAIHRTNVGPKWLTPKEAAAFADKCDAMPQVSPLRDPSRSEADSAEVLGAQGDARPLNEADHTGDPPVIASPEDETTRAVSASSQSGREPSSLGFWPD